MSNMFRDAMAALCLATLAVPVLATVIYDETTDGDLSGDYSNPTAISLSLGSTIVMGSTGRDSMSGLIDRDYFTFTIPAGESLISVKILADTQTGGALGAFIGIRAGATGTNPSAPQAVQAADLLGYSLYGSADIGLDILGRMGTANTLTPPAQGFTVPLPMGTYTFWIQEGSVGAYPYGFDLQVQNVSEPASVLLMGVGLAGLRASQRRRAT